MIKEYEDCGIVFESLFSTAIWFVPQEKENKSQLILSKPWIVLTLIIQTKQNKSIVIH